MHCVKRFGPIVLHLHPAVKGRGLRLRRRRRAWLWHRLNRRGRGGAGRVFCGRRRRFLPARNLILAGNKDPVAIPPHAFSQALPRIAFPAGFADRYAVRNDAQHGSQYRQELPQPQPYDNIPSSNTDTLSSVLLWGQGRETSPPWMRSIATVNPLMRRRRALDHPVRALLSWALTKPSRRYEVPQVAPQPQNRRA